MQGWGRTAVGTAIDFGETGAFESRLTYPLENCSIRSDSPDQPRLAVAERLRRELQRKAARRAAEPKEGHGSSPTSARRSRSRPTGGTSTTTRGRTACSATLRRRPTWRGLPPLCSGLRPSAPPRQARNLCFRWDQPDSHSAGPEIEGRSAAASISAITISNKRLAVAWSSFRVTCLLANSPLLQVDNA